MLPISAPSWRTNAKQVAACVDYRNVVGNAQAHRFRFCGSQHVLGIFERQTVVCSRHFFLGII
jgi:hypothetical protein